MLSIVNVIVIDHTYTTYTDHTEVHTFTSLSMQLASTGVLHYT
jgi:hypothetical protein